jgi:hypothetical protein
VQPDDPCSQLALRPPSAKRNYCNRLTPCPESRELRTKFEVSGSAGTRAALEPERAWLGATITLVGGVGFAWPLSVRGQQQARRIAVLGGGLTEEGSEAKANIAGLLEVLQQSAWTVGGNLRVDARWVAGDPVEIRKHAAELVALAPDVILASGTVALGSLLQATSIVPVVFVNVPGRRRIC